MKSEVKVLRDWRDFFCKACQNFANCFKSGQPSSHQRLFQNFRCHFIQFKFFRSLGHNRIQDLIFLNKHSIECKPETLFVIWTKDHILCPLCMRQVWNVWWWWFGCLLRLIYSEIKSFTSFSFEDFASGGGWGESYNCLHLGRDCLNHS